MTEAVDVVFTPRKRLSRERLPRPTATQSAQAPQCWTSCRKFASLIREDADLRLAVDVMRSAFCNAGQMCGALSASARQGLIGRLSLKSRDD